MEASRWEKIWSFLSLSITGRFSDELWLPECVATHRAEIREIVRDAPLFHPPAWKEVSYELFRAVDPTLSEDAESVFIWGEYLFVKEGPDRAAETVWEMVPFWIRDAKDISPPPWMAELMRRLRAKVDERRSSLEGRISAIREQAVDQWDALELKRRWEEMKLEAKPGEPGGEIRVEPIFDTISLIAGYNGFLLSWEEVCRATGDEEAKQLYGIAVELARRNNMPLDVAFPGSWRVPVQRFLKMKSREHT